MATSIPEQIRTVDPYASYNSNVVNQLTGIVSRGSNVLDYYNALQVMPDSTSVLDHVEVLPGIVYKDDMLIEVTSPFRLDFTDPQHYVSSGALTPFIQSEDGYYYVVLEYTYAKSRPAPQAHLKILAPSQTASFRLGNFPALFFLKAVDVLAGAIVELYDYDPDYVDTKRIHARRYTGTEIGLPTFDAARDQTRMVYVPNEDEFYFGYANDWGPAGGGGSVLRGDTSAFAVGDLVYMTSTGDFALANGVLGFSSADGVVKIVGVNGTVQTTGYVEGVPVDSASALTTGVGTLLYASTIEDGKVSNTKSSPYWQFVGRVMEMSDSTTANILFVRGEPNGATGISLVTYLETNLAGGSWISDSGSVRQDIDISTFSGDDIITDVWDSTTKIQVEDMEYVDDDTLRIWMPSGFAGDLDAITVGSPLITSGAANVQKVAQVDLAGTLTPSGGKFYADVDISDIDLSLAIVETWTGTEIVMTDEVEYIDATTLRVWLPVNTTNLYTVAIGGATATSAISSLRETLAAGSAWISDGSNYYQDIDVSGLSYLIDNWTIYDIKDNATGFRIEPIEVDTPTIDTLRVIMPDQSKALDVVVIG